MAVAPEEFTLAIEEMADQDVTVETQAETRARKGRPAKRKRGDPREAEGDDDPAARDNMTLRSGSKLTRVPVATQTQQPEEPIEVEEEDDDDPIPCSQNRRERSEPPGTPRRQQRPPPVRRLEMVETDAEETGDDSDATVDLEEEDQQPQGEEAREIKKARRILRRCDPVLEEKDDPSPPPPADAQALVEALTQLASTQGREERGTRRDQPFYEPVTLQTYDGGEDFADYLTQFAAIASLKSWSPQQKATILLGRLKGPALSVAATLCEPTYDQLVEHLKSHFGPRHAESYAIQLSAREQQKGETLSEFAHAIRKLTRGAYPDLDARAQDRLARERFVAGISDTHVRTRLRDLRPQSMAKALEEARILSENKEAEKQRARRIGGWTGGDEQPQQPAAQQTQQMTAPAPQPAQWTAQPQQMQQMTAPAPQPAQWTAQQPQVAQPAAAQPAVPAVAQTVPPAPQPSTDLVVPLQELVRQLQLQQPGQQAPYRRPGRPGNRGQQQQQRRRPTATPTTQCWQCQQYGHFSKDCPTKQTAGRGGPQYSQTSQAPPQQQQSQPQMTSQQASQGVPPLIPVPPPATQQMSFPVMSQPVPSLPPHQPVMFQPQLHPGSLDFGSAYGGPPASGAAQMEASRGPQQSGNGSGQQ